jgi:hypothetical protein
MESRYQKLSEVKLHPWQKSVIDAIEGHEDLRESEQYQGVSDYAINSNLGIVLSMPKGSGHTFLCNYIAAKYPTMLVYSKMKHYVELAQRFSLHQDTDTISLFEIYYALHKPGLQVPSVEYMDIKRRFEGKRVCVVDNGLSLSDELKTFLYNVSQGIVILLGH